MKLSYKKWLMLVLPACIFMSCKKELNVFPSDRQVDGNVIIDAKSAGTVLNGVYYRFANSSTDNNGVPSLRWIDVFETVPSELSGLLVNNNTDGLNDFTVNRNSPAAAGKWGYAYNLVNAANGFLKNIEPVTTIADNTKKQLQAEARFLRAFGNADLLFHYGQYRDINSKYGIIIRDKFVNSDNINLPRSNVKDSYDGIIADLDVAIAGLPLRNTKLSYANVWVAKLLKARVLMNRGIGTDYATVISLTDDIIKSSNFKLEGSTKDIFLTLGASSQEVMMIGQPFPNDTYKYMQYQYYNQYMATPKLAKMMENDPRAAWTFKPIVKRGATVNTFTKYYSGSPTTISFTPLSVNAYAFRLTEAYLLQAEALALSGGDLALAKGRLKEVMGHAGLTDFATVDGTSSAAAFQVLVVKETMKNFVAENGLDWLALRRLPFATIQSADFRPEIKSETSLILPVPSTELNTNNIADQNPGYSRN
ncbi:MAG: RagB/SusD family nutrient uptake outer membrane protein [Candidatus Pedobacter colombiensis]|uniref:RagB/SusD family nutrient uptake outer membrane protein n=1 Tax=Candidatus Pedobacter colombiensis TaxID=3121371 RepID=A0AAJ6B8Q5_9SPHI|nr:RagB/SusD family nutrient uptake outer membrane protein [Pedobacter sp.]WEK21630.1 MAG: RagB/SusD family nutrient uptake outer membrane protein [Pedobacter sp.]